MSTQHTPGPWHISGSTIKGPHPKDPQNRLRLVAETVFDKGTWIDETRANARLIAAAPDLLEALQFVMTAHGEQLDTAFAQAHAAIAKATGEQP
jgi:2-oxo-4-hydroxy-4-carboxy--5-ureidoimidazoline (OHCU) decarboxylase